jgi:hypothetical protein
MTEVEVNGIVCAKTTEGEVANPNFARYWVLVSRQTTRIYNPIEDESRMSYRDSHGIDPWRFVRVNELCYKYYLRFLESKAHSWYRRAEREVINAPV